MIKDYFKTPQTLQLFAANHLDSFDDIWNLQSEWFEEPNYRRNGWSGVVKDTLTGDHGEPHPIFIKRQENHNYKTLLHPFKGIPTFRREFINIRRLCEHQIPTLTTLYYAERKVDGKLRAILVTESLEGFQSIEDYWKQFPELNSILRKWIMQRTGQVLRNLHDANFQHNGLYPKHIFVRINDIRAGQDQDVRLIDLEKLKWMPSKQHIRRSDLARVIRRSAPMNQNDLQTLISSYLNCHKDLSNTKLAADLQQMIENQFSRHLG
jgi:uncharacterized protein YwbE